MIIVKPGADVDIGDPNAPVFPLSFTYFHKLQGPTHLPKNRRKLWRRVRYRSTTLSILSGSNQLPSIRNRISAI